MRSARLPVSILILLSCLFAPTAQGAEEEPLPVEEAGNATLELDGRRSPIAYSRTYLGPRFALQPIASRLGGALEVGPLGQRHALTFGQSEYVFGPDSRALTVGEEIVDLSQPPAAGAGGLHVPLDLLRATYGAALGYALDWRPSERLLVVARTPPRELSVSFDAVELQGITTLVFQFPERPRYRLTRRPGSIEVELVGDRMRPRGTPEIPTGSMVRGVRMAADRIRIDLAPGAGSNDYVLEDPFRIVFDVFTDRTEPVATGPKPPPRRPLRRSGIRTIVIDPGHGGSDTGATGPNGTMEKDLTLALARTLEQRLEARLPVRVVLTRRADAELPLDTRTALANQNKADLFISVHLNSAVASYAQGAETYFASLDATDERAALAAEVENRAGADADPLYDLQLMLWDLAQSLHMSDSQRLAGLIQEELNVALGLRNRGVKQAPFTVLMGAAMPAVLVELGFLSNSEEEQRLNDPAYRGRLADALVRAVSRYRAQGGEATAEAGR